MLLTFKVQKILNVIDVDINMTMTVQHFRLTDSQVQNVEPAKVNRDVALRAL
jgi:hypothetical protein